VHAKLLTTANTGTNQRDTPLASPASRVAPFIVVVVVSIAAYLPYQFWKRPSSGDRANWDYIAQVIVRGGVPYRDVVNIKTPLSAYIAAGAIVVTRPFGLRDVIAIRVCYTLLAALTVGVTLLVAEAFLKSHRIALIAAIIMMGIDLFGSVNSDGVQPKTPMILFGLLALWLMIKGQPFASGFFGMLSALSWQPGLLFVGAGALGFSRYLTNWRDRKAARLVAGALLPLAVFVLYFWFKGALRDFYSWNFDFNLTVNAPRNLRTAAGVVDRFERLLKNGYRPERIYFCLAIAGLIRFCFLEYRRARQYGWRALLERAPTHAVVIAPAVYFIFCTINIQGGADFIPLLPFIAIFAAIAIVWFLDLLCESIIEKRFHWPARPARSTAIIAAGALIFIFSVCDIVGTKVPFPTLNDQQGEVDEMVSHLSPGDLIYVHGLAELLVLSNRANADPHFILDRGKDNYLDEIEPGGFEGWLDRLKGMRPRVVAIDRTKTIDHKAAFSEWLESEYDEKKGRIFTYHLRK